MNPLGLAVGVLLVTFVVILVMSMTLCVWLMDRSTKLLDRMHERANRSEKDFDASARSEMGS
jgi:CBS domain containing-hemolysin-like protein